MPMNLTSEQATSFQNFRRQWYDVMKPIAGFGPSNLIEPIPDFLPEHLDGARLLPNREMVMNFLKSGQVIAEVGTQQGVFARKLHDQLAPCELHLFEIDFAPFHERGTFKDLPGAVTLHQGDSSTQLAAMPDNYFDIIYIDGDHSYAGAKRDTEVAKRKLKPDGVLWFNDFTLWSPVEMIDYGVPYVVSELCHSGEWKIDFLALHSLFYHDIVLSRRSC